MLSSKSCSLIGLSVALLLCSAALASPVNIDTFDDGSLQFSVFGQTVDDDSESGSGIIGGERHVQIDTTNATTGNTGIGLALAAVDSGSITFGTITVAPSFGGAFGLQYDCDPSVDLLNDDGTPNTGILFDLDTADHDYTLQVMLYTDYSAGIKASISQAFSADEAPHQAFLAFDDFTKDAGFDLESIDVIQIRLLGVNNGDYHINNISAAAVPEPVTLGLLAVGGVGLVLRRRRK